MWRPEVYLGVFSNGSLPYFGTGSPSEPRTRWFGKISWPLSSRDPSEPSLPALKLQRLSLCYAHPQRDSDSGPDAFTVDTLLSEPSLETSRRYFVLMYISPVNRYKAHYGNIYYIITHYLSLIIIVVTSMVIIVVNFHCQVDKI